MSHIFKRIKIIPALLALLMMIPAASCGSTRDANTETEKETETESAVTAGAPEVGEDEETVQTEEEIPAADPAASESSMRALSDEEAKKYKQRTNIPTLYIETETDYKRIKHGTYMNAVYTLVSDGQGIVGQPLQIKGRGNYSWSFPQKPYTIKLESGEPLLGMTKGKKWVLVTTYSDKTLLRNYLTLNMSSRTLGMDYAVEAEYVDVYLDGEYNGLYVLSEKVDLGKSRVDADALFEIEAKYRHDDCSDCVICPSGCHILFKEPIDEITDAKEHAALLKEYRELIQSADRAMEEGSDAYLDYIDVDSFVDWYIINELVKNYDSGFTTSCYFAVKDGKLYMGPCWDYDTCMGNQVVAECVNPVGYHVAFSPWYSMLLNDEYFTDALCARWTQLYNDGVFDGFLKSIDDTAKIIADSEKLDHAKYPAALTNHDLRGDLSRETWEDELDYLRDWVSSRISWLNSQWNDDIREGGLLDLASGKGGTSTRPAYADDETKKLFKSLENLTASVGVTRVRATVDGYGSEQVGNAFDGDPATKYCWPSNGESEITFTSKQAIAPTHYALMTANDTYDYSRRNPQKWKIYGSVDNKSWELMTEVNNGRDILTASNFTWHVFEIDNPGSYQYFKIWLDNDDVIQFSEIAFLK